MKNDDWFLVCTNSVFISPRNDRSRRKTRNCHEDFECSQEIKRLPVVVISTHVRIRSDYVTRKKIARGRERKKNISKRAARRKREAGRRSRDRYNFDVYLKRDAVLEFAQRSSFSFTMATKKKIISWLCTLQYRKIQI